MAETHQTRIARSFWCCTACGKWSTAKRNPKKHKRFVGEDVPEGSHIADSGVHYEHDTGASYEVFWVWCGPFEEWRAHRVDTAV